MKKIIITEGQLRKILTENVYINKNTANDKKKTFDLSYTKGNFSHGNYNSQDMLKTDKMDNGLGDDTYEVPLKGGIMSYNITSINGSAVMHYFKRYFDNEKTEIDVKTDNGTEKYSLIMKDPEFRQFIDQFSKKVNAVVTYQLKRMGVEVDRISIYPVPSSHKFNEKMAEIMARYNLGSLPCQIINQSLFVKDLRNLERDEEFISKNKDFYNGNLSNSDNFSVSTALDTSIEKATVMQNRLKPYIAKMNEYERLLLGAYFNYNHSGSEVTLKTMAKYYRMYYDLWAECQKLATYFDGTRGKVSSIQQSRIASPIAYSKGPSIEHRSQMIWQYVKQFFRNKKSPINGESYTAMPIQVWRFNDFEIKNLSNGERMGMKNIYNPNLDPEIVKQEIERIKGTAFVIFDDNISGGATLSDICHQCKKLGIDNIIPITFGQMAEKWQIGMKQLNKPVSNNGEIGKFTLSENE